MLSLAGILPPALTRATLAHKNLHENQQTRRAAWRFFFQAEDGIRDIGVTGVQTCALPIWRWIFFLTGAIGSLWTIWWRISYFVPNVEANGEEQSQVTERLSLVGNLRWSSLLRIRSEERRVGKEGRERGRLRHWGKGLGRVV